MKLLVLGGTQFLGRHLVEKARAAGHQITLFNRGRTNPTLFKDVGTIVGDRDYDLHKLFGKSWDVVVDTCGYFPQQLQKSASSLKDSVGHYIYISSMSVYENPIPHTDEQGPTYKLAEGTDPNVPNDLTYGIRKKLCEDAVEAIMPGRVMHIRAGLIVGPYDQTWRYPYWVDRIRRGGTVCAPESPAFPIRYIDAEDLSDWILHSIWKNTTGIFNALGPSNTYTFGEFLNECVELINPKCKLVWMSSEFLNAEGIKPWSDLPLWLPPEHLNLHLLSFQKAIDAGLQFTRPSKTILKTLKWIESGEPLPVGDGLRLEIEDFLLEKWANSFHSDPR